MSGYSGMMVLYLILSLNSVVVTVLPMILAILPVVIAPRVVGELYASEPEGSGVCLINSDGVVFHACVCCCCR